MASLDKFVERMRYWCDEGNLGYDQGNRWDIRYGGECDCSSLVIFALREAGFDTGSASYTGDLSSNLTARGWVRLSPNVDKQVGDILLNDGHHVAAVTGSNQMSYASIDENGRARGGMSGDQTGRETKTVSGFSYSRGWSCVLRYKGGSGQPASSSSSPSLLRRGSTGSIVTRIQQRLMELGYRLPKFGADGSFGGETEDAVRAFQRDRGLEVDGIVGPATTTALNAAKHVESTAQESGGIAVDGQWGRGTTSALQKLLGTPVDGIISGQHRRYMGSYPAALSSSWEWNNGRGSSCIKVLQRSLGTSADGIAGPGTARALQQHLGVSVDGIVGQQTVKALQRRINAGSF